MLNELFKRVIKKNQGQPGKAVGDWAGGRASHHPLDWVIVAAVVINFPVIFRVVKVVVNQIVS
jgi:hypothetical protein